MLSVSTLDTTTYVCPWLWSTIWKCQAPAWIVEVNKRIQQISGNVNVSPRPTTPHVNSYLEFWNIWKQHWTMSLTSLHYQQYIYYTSVILNISISSDFGADSTCWCNFIVASLLTLLPKFHPLFISTVIKWLYIH